MLHHDAELRKLLAREHAEALARSYGRAAHRHRGEEAAAQAEARAKRRLRLRRPAPAYRAQ